MAQNRIARLDKLVSASPESGYALNFVFVYEDTETRKWAREVFDRVAKLGGDDGVRATWWKMSELSAPVVLAGAVSTAMRADIIVVATRAAEGLPLPFYLWVKEWLPHRSKGAGALVALLATPSRKDLVTGRVKDYLRGAAAAGRLDFLIEQRELPAEPAEHFPNNGNGRNGHTAKSSSWKMKAVLKTGRTAEVVKQSPEVC